MKRSILLAGAIVMACPMFAPPALASGTRAADSAAKLPTTAAAYVKLAAAGDLFEIQSSQLALKKARSAEVRQFAQMLIDDHNKASQALKTAAEKAKVAVPVPQLDAGKKTQIQALTHASAQAFDDLYLAQQVRAHEKALALHQTFARNGDKPTLKTNAQTATTMIEKHLTTAKRLAAAGG
ncbi:DUF4142 domain-containing protein [Rhizorhapis suberifaciens]|uniref:Putative membrane protein n=1 Tax=Rhizorhapis suberifaciens TaxID=13656 RepID=A0A840HVE2_9SPHN|nr:DUF4142 domain-containing protein [Rhizorhapis suberifaciens]MBB4641577.1 putative membrane protein [Rhizorhapis suberifaciens]